MKWKYRLLKKQDFSKTLDLKNRIWSKYFLCYYKKNNGLKNIRFGILITKKISKKATVRNFIRRRIKAILSNNLDLLPNYDCVILVRREILEVKEFNKFEKDLVNLILKIKKIKT